MKIETNKSHRAVIYCRVSTEEQTLGGSLDYQEKECISFAQRHSLEVIRIFREEGESGRSGIETGGSRCDRLKKRRKNPFGERQPRKIAEEKEYCGNDNEDCRCYQYDLTLHTVFFEMPLVCVNIVPGQKSNTAHNN